VNGDWRIENAERRSAGEKLIPLSGLRVCAAATGQSWLPENFASRERMVAKKYSFAKRTQALKMLRVARQDFTKTAGQSVTLKEG
jgi:hypothetical protein